MNKQSSSQYDDHFCIFFLIHIYICFCHGDITKMVRPILGTTGFDVLSTCVVNVIATIPKTIGKY